MPGRIVIAWRTDTGEQVEVPEHWLGHPQLGRNLTTTRPAAKAAPKPPATGDTAKEK